MKSPLLVLLTLLPAACMYDYSSLRGRDTDGGGGSGGVVVDAAIGDLPHDRAIAADSLPTDAKSDAAMETNSDTGPSPGRPNGAGCVSDSQCLSGICAKASATDTSGACCDGRPDTCNTCVGGFKTPLQDDSTVDACNVCRAGKITPLKDGTACAAPDCVGDVKYLGVWYRSARYQFCAGGHCSVVVVRDCTTALTCTDGTTQNCGSQGICGRYGTGDCSCADVGGDPPTCGYSGP
jgi:hypothetical protein